MCRELGFTGVEAALDIKTDNQDCERGAYRIRYLVSPPCKTVCIVFRGKFLGRLHKGA